MNWSFGLEQAKGVGVEQLPEEVAGLNGAEAYDSGVVSRIDSGKSRTGEWDG
jgi:hypothetical protein